MSYLLTQILVCLLIAGLIGAIIGWLFRGNCKKSIRECEDKWKRRVGEIEESYNSRRYEDPNMQSVSLKQTNNIFDDKSDLKIDRQRLSIYKEYGINPNETKDIEDRYELHTIDDIEPLHIHKLSELGFNSTKDLSSLIGNQKTTEKVAEELEIGVNRVKRWASIANLLELPGVDAKSAKLLQKSGIDSIKDLAKTDLDDIYTKLERLNSEFNILNKLPSKNMLSIWSKISKHLS